MILQLYKQYKSTLKMIQTIKRYFLREGKGSFKQKNIGKVKEGKI